MNSRLIISGVALAIVLIGLGIGGFRMYKSPSVECDRGASALPADAPLELAAMLDRDCAMAYIESYDRDGIRIALGFGYPSILLEYVDRDEALNNMFAAVEDGYRGAFQNDPALLDRLEAMEDQRPAVATILDFIISLQAPDRIAEADDPLPRLEFLPVWNSDANASRLVSMCDDLDCSVGETVCENHVGLGDKLALSRGDMTLDTLIGKCPVTRDWVLALRRAGVVDTSCSLTLQLNAARIDTRVLTQGCFPGDTQLRDYDAFTPSDAVTFLREWVKSGGERRVDSRSLSYIASLFPDSAGYVAVANSK